MNADAARAVLFTQCEVTDPPVQVKGILVQRAPVLANGVHSIIVLLTSGRWVPLTGIASVKDARALVLAASLPDTPNDTRTCLFLRDVPDISNLPAGGKLVPVVEFEDMW